MAQLDTKKTTFGELLSVEPPTANGIGIGRLGGSCRATVQCFERVKLVL